MLASLQRFVIPCAWILCCLTWQPLAAAEKETLTPERLATLRYVTQARISPSGQLVAYVLSVPRLPWQKGDDGPAYAELHVVDRQGQSRPFVTGQVNVSQVSWNSAGDEIRFLSKRTGDEATSLYAIPVGGGEARKILSHEKSVSGYSFSPDEKQVAFLATEPDTEEQKKRKKQGFSQQIYEEDNPSVRVWIRTLADDDAKPRLLELAGSASELHWSPTGELLAVALAPTPLVDDHYMARKVHLVRVQDGKIAANLKNPGKLGHVAWSPDGEQLAVISGENINDPKDGRLWIYGVDGAKKADILPNYPGHVTDMVWTDPNHVVYMADRSVWTTVSKITANGQQADGWIPVGSAVLTGLSLALDGNTAACVGESSAHPGEVVLLEKGANKPRRLTDSNPWLKSISLARQQVVTHNARDGLPLEGILVRPLNEEEGKRYPLILAVHGGPEAHIRNGWVTYYSRPGQTAAAAGFAVFYPNYRGSTGRGVAFSKMGQGDAAGKEFDDLVDAVDHLVERGWVDKDRVGITGGSYGGYASAWGATYYSHRFAASVMFVGISNNLSKVGTTDIPYEMYHVHHLKWLWDDRDYFATRSPIWHIEKAKTPTLILHGKEDPRVHPSQSMELYRHLKVRGKAPVRLVFYPGEGHGNRRAASRLDYNLRLLRWMKHFLQPENPAATKKAPPRDLDYSHLSPKDAEKATPAKPTAASSQQPQETRTASQ